MFFLIDVASVASVSLLKSAGIADLVIIPAQPNEDDFIEAINTKERAFPILTNRPGSMC